MKRKKLAIASLVLGILAVLVLVVLLPAFFSPLHRRIPRNEAQAIRDIRTLISVAKMYAAANGGLFDNVQCLVAPRDCIPGYPVESSSFPEGYGWIRWEGTYHKSGYERRFFAGPPAELTDSTRSGFSNEPHFFCLRRCTVEPGHDRGP